MYLALPTLHITVTCYCSYSVYTTTVRNSLGVVYNMVTGKQTNYVLTTASRNSCIINSTYSDLKTTHEDSPNTDTRASIRT